jgi:hypothetical protein
LTTPLADGTDTGRELKMRNSSKQIAWAGIALLAVVSAPNSVSAKPEFFEAFLAEYPFVVGTRIESCNVCHTMPPRRNDYGTDFNIAGRVFSVIESTDSDNDGFDNITEIMALTFPGNPDDNPNSTPAATATPTHTFAPTSTPSPTNTTGPTNTPRPTNTRKPTPTIVPGPCYGDCNENGVVAVNELILAVNINLGNASVDVCMLADDNGNGQVSIDELIKAVNRNLYGCPVVAF